MSKNLMPMKANVEVLNEMESLMILGGADNGPKPTFGSPDSCTAINMFSCASNTYCGSANCVYTCGGGSTIKPLNPFC